MWAVLAVDGLHWVCHNSSLCVLPESTLLRLQGALQGHCRKWALRFVHFPDLSHSGSRVLWRGTDPDWLYILCPSQVWAAQVTGCLASTLSQGDHGSYSPPQSLPVGFLGEPQEHSPRCVVCLLWIANLRLWHSWQMSTVQIPWKTWVATGSPLTVWWKM